MQHLSHPRTVQRIVIGVAVLAAVAALVSVGQPSPAHGADATSAVVSTKTTNLGRILVDAHGRTLYLFARDRGGKSSCTGQCAKLWPPLITRGRPGVSNGAKASLIGTVRRADGHLQVTYNNHPLYTFVRDTKAGQTNGEEVNAFGAEWYVLSTAGRSVAKNTSSSNGYGR